METISAAAHRLLQRLERRADKVAGNQSPDKIKEISPNAPWAGKEAAEMAAVSAYLSGYRGLGDDKAVVIPANDNNAGWTSGEYDHRASPTLNPDGSAMPKTARIVTLRGFEW